MKKYVSLQWSYKILFRKPLFVPTKFITYLKNIDSNHGGPYYISNSSKKIDLLTNVAIWHLLSAYGIYMPHLTRWLWQQLNNVKDDYLLSVKHVQIVYWFWNAACSSVTDSLIPKYKKYLTFKDTEKLTYNVLQKYAEDSLIDLLWQVRNKYIRISRVKDNKEYDSIADRIKLIVDCLNESLFKEMKFLGIYEKAVLKQIISNIKKECNIASALVSIVVNNAEYTYIVSKSVILGLYALTLLDKIIDKDEGYLSIKNIGFIFNKWFDTLYTIGKVYRFRRNHVTKIIRHNFVGCRQASLSKVIKQSLIPFLVARYDKQYLNLILYVVQFFKITDDLHDLLIDHPNINIVQLIEDSMKPMLSKLHKLSRKLIKISNDNVYISSCVKKLRIMSPKLTNEYLKLLQS